MTFKDLARFALLCFACSQAQAAAPALNDAWSFYRDDGRTVTSAEQVPAGSWQQVNLPHAANIEPRVPTAPWQGTVFYKKQLDVRLRPGERAILRFDAVMNVADVWLNGQHLEIGRAHV